MNIINRIKQFFSLQYNLSKQAKDKYGRVDLSSFNKKIELVKPNDETFRLLIIVLASFQKKNLTK